MSNEFQAKQERIQALLQRLGLDGLVLRRASSFAWATCGGRSSVNTASSEGAASLLVTRNHRYLLTTNIEAPRLEQEEALQDQGWEPVVTPWYEPQEALHRITAGLKIGADGSYPGSLDLSKEVARLRSELTPEEGERFRVLGRLCAAAMDRAVREIAPGMSEYEIASLLARASLCLGVQPVVNLVGADERVFKFRHPLPTGKQLKRYAMLVLCGRMAGLVCSLTRFVHFGPIPGEVCRKVEAAARVDAALIDATRPGRRLGEVFQEGIAAYAAAGYPDEWRLHHQGGPAGYEPREALAAPQSEETILAGQAFAWNPSIAGTKCEDTILVGAGGNEVLTAIPGWPVQKVIIRAQEYLRPAILEVG